MINKTLSSIKICNVHDRDKVYGEKKNGICWGI
jgi:hypothetical protein